VECNHEHVKTIRVNRGFALFGYDYCGNNDCGMILKETEIETDKRTSPNDGGCWFCYKVSNDMLFDTEFDTYLHKECLIGALQKAKQDKNYETEAVFMTYLLDADELDSI
jgi:hypothetical protein